MNDSDVSKNAHKQREISKRGLSQQYENTESCWSFYNADQMTYSDRIQFEDTWGRKRRAMVNFNKVQQNVDAVVGFAAQNRRQAKFLAHVPLNMGQEIYSKNMNALYTFHRENTYADHIETELDLDMMVNGYSGSDTDLSYMIGNATTMPNGEIVKERIDPTCLYWDPAAKGQNLSDAKWCGYWRDFELKDALSLFQGSTESDFEEVSAEEPSDTGFTFNPYGGIYSKIKLMNTVEWTSKESEMVRVYNHQWFEYETFYKCENPIYKAPSADHALFYRARLDIIRSNVKLPGDTIKGDAFDLNPASETITFDEPTKRALVKEFGDLITPIAFKRKVYYTAVLSGDHVFTWFKSISQSGFSIKFKTGTWNRNRKMWMGMVNPMMEPQKYFNKALTELMFTIAANSKGGVYVEEDAVDDIADFEEKYAKTDGVIKLTSGALAAGKVQDKARPALPTGLENIINLSEANIAANGVDPAFLGDIGRDDQSGVLYKRRLRQVISKFARYFDSIERYQKSDARLNADLIPVWLENNQGQWVRITGPDGAEEFMRLAEDMLAPYYDVTIQEASMSSDQKTETAIMLGQMSDKLMSVGDVDSGKSIMVEMLPFMTGIDGDVRSRISKSIGPKEQINPQVIQAMQAELEQFKKLFEAGQVEKTQSEIAYNLARARQMEANVEVTKAKVPNTQADTALKLENAQKASVESAVMVVNPDKEVQVQI